MAHKWTDSELAMVMDKVLPDADLAQELGVSVQAVRTARWAANNGKFRGGGTGYSEDPFKVGSRRLLAKTCLSCGKLIDARFFRKIKESRTSSGSFSWDSSCKWCVSRTSRKRPSRRNTAYDLQSRSLEWTTNRYQEYTLSDHIILADPQLTRFEKAFSLKRTYFSVVTMCSKNNYPSRDPRKSLPPERVGQWQIQFPNNNHTQ
jgi:hypothetical protein